MSASAARRAPPPLDARVHVAASPETVFALWADAPSWPDWDPGLERAALEGPFADGSEGRLKAHGAPPTTIVLSDVRPARAFTATARLPLCRLVFEHVVEPVGDGCRVRHAIRFEGVLAPLFRRLLGATFERDLPLTLAGLKAAAEARGGA